MVVTVHNVQYVVALGERGGREESVMVAILMEEVEGRSLLWLLQ
jgi:hypothetical protein